ncbi:MAG: RNA polymerase sigma-70 factor [Prevotella sp.]|jgi:RNA polymerase sigma-70 factor (family 1)|nr:RNA polymerase sigma-70 factor [Prevotella sp.]MCI1281891.1 RNA polymerase sigma-70 factor [Prevotella sp.]
MPKYEDHNLLMNDIIDGNDKAYEYLFKVYYPRLHNFACRFIKDEDTIRDIIQNSIISLYEKRDTFTSESIEALLFTIVRRGCLNQLKHEAIVQNYQNNWKDQHDYDTLYNIDFLNQPEHALLYNELREEVQSTLDAMPERDRTIFLLSRSEGLKNKEIALKLGISVKTVEKYITRVTKIFRNKFGEENMAFILLILLLSHPK